MENSYAYDSLYRLIQAGGTCVVTAGTYDYTLDMAYELSGKIKAKGLAASLNSNPIAALTYNPDYDYQDLPHAPSSISGENMQCYNNEYQ